MFGRKMMLANEDGIIPTEEQRGLDGNDGDEESTERKLPDWSEIVKEAPQSDPNYYPLSNEEENADQDNNNEGAGDENDTDLKVLEQRGQDIQVQRAGAHETQKEQAQKMMENSKRRPQTLPVHRRLHDE